MFSKRFTRMLEEGGSTPPAVKKRETVNVNSNLVKSTIAGQLFLKLSQITTQLANLPYKVDSNGYLSITFRENDMSPVNFSVPVQNINKFFTADTFNANFFFCFQKQFPQSVYSTLFPGLNIVITNDLPFNNNTTVNLDEMRPFRMFCCLLLGLAFNIKIDACACYPQTPAELQAVKSGIGLNCVSLECKNFLLKNPNAFDPLVNSECSNIGIQAAFVSISAFAGGNINFNDLSISQVYNCISASGAAAVG